MEQFDNLLRAYADGQLTGDTLAELERRLQQEPDLRADLDVYLALKAADNVRLKRQLGELAQIEQLKPAKVPHPIRRALPLLAAAASVTLFLAAWWWWQKPPQPSPTALAQTYIATPYPDFPTTMGASDGRALAERRAFDAYRQRDFEGAARHFAPLAAAPTASDTLLFYAGESELQNKHWAEALAYFDRVRPGYWREPADWRSALACLQSDQPARARALLEKLRTGPRKAQVEALLEAGVRGK